MLDTSSYRLYDYASAPSGATYARGRKVLVDHLQSHAFGIVHTTANSPEWDDKRCKSRLDESVVFGFAGSFRRVRWRGFGSGWSVVHDPFFSWTMESRDVDLCLRLLYETSSFTEIVSRCTSRCILYLAKKKQEVGGCQISVIRLRASEEFAIPARSVWFIPRA